MAGTDPGSSAEASVTLVLRLWRSGPTWRGRLVEVTTRHGAAFEGLGELGDLVAAILEELATE